MPIICTALLVVFLVTPSFAESFNWADRDGFHSVEQITQVPLEHRKDLPMAHNLTSLPFTAEENRDGAMFVWYILDQKGMNYPYAKTADLPQSPFFRVVLEPRPGDIAWWKDFMAIYRGEKGMLVSASGDVPLRTMGKKRGKAVWYRYIGPILPTAPPPARKAPLKTVRTANEALLGLNGAATFPPEFKDNAERDLLRNKWEKAASDMEALRKQYPDDPQVLRLMGVCYRLGYNLGMPGAWERAEAYLLWTEELAPEAPEAFISLGILYGDSKGDYAGQSERQFRLALRHARKEQLPQIWWGLSLALHNQGNSKEAIKIIDRLIALHPDDVKAKNLRETFLKGAREEKNMNP